MVIIGNSLVNLVHVLIVWLSRPDEKAVILMESGIRLHSTGFDWPKNPAPSGFSMKVCQDSDSPEKR